MKVGCETELVTDSILLLLAFLAPYVLNICYVLRCWSPTTFDVSDNSRCWDFFKVGKVMTWIPKMKIMAVFTNILFVM